MEKKKNIIYIAGTDSYGVSLELTRWKKRFRESQDGLNIETIRIEEIKNWSQLEAEMISVGLFAEKRLFCISGGIVSKNEKSFRKDDTENTPSKKDIKSAEGEEKLIQICETLPDDHFIIFSNLTLSAKSSKLLKWLENFADKRVFSEIWNLSIWLSRFPGLEKNHVQKIIEAYKKAESGREGTRDTLSDAIGNSLEKLSLISLSKKVTEDDIENSILTEASGKIFDLSDAILRGDYKNSLLILKDIMESTNIYALLPLLIGILRSSIYVKSLQNNGKTERKIGQFITMNPYMLGKAYSAKISYEKLRRFYNEILSINIAYRSGKGMKDPELGRIFAIELAILGLKK